MISSAITGVIVALLIAGTGFDFYLVYLKGTENGCKSIKCTTYTNSELPPTNDRHIKLNPSSNLEVKNGKYLL